MAVCARSAQWRASTGSWATLPTTDVVKIEREYDYYDIFIHGDFRVKTPSFWLLPAMAHTGAYGPFVPVPLNGTRQQGYGRPRLRPALSKSSGNMTTMIFSSMAISGSKLQCLVDVTEGEDLLTK